MTMLHTPRQSGALPGFNLFTLMLMIVSGSVATVAFDIWGQVISPWFLGWANLSPTGLARSLGQNVLGLEGERTLPGFGNFMHLFLVGLIGYPVGWLFIFRPIWERIGNPGGWLVGGALYGFGLWIFAIGGITYLAGLPFFLSFTGITWVAMIGHTLYGLVCAAIVRWLEGPAV